MSRRLTHLSTFDFCNLPKYSFSHFLLSPPFILELDSWLISAFDFMIAFSPSTVLKFQPCYQSHFLVFVYVILSRLPRESSNENTGEDKTFNSFLWRLWTSSYVWWILALIIKESNFISYIYSLRSQYLCKSY